MCLSKKEFCLSKFLKVIDNQQSNFCVLPKQKLSGGIYTILYISIDL
nr:MAG TPA: hypothetical protein [Caudoviricetes sp.]